MDTDKISFEKKYSTDMCWVTIKGLSIPHTKKFNPFAKLYTQTKRCFRDWIGIDVVGTFVYDDANSTVACLFILNNAFGDPEKRLGIFKKYKEAIIDTFEELLLSFIKSSYYKEYLMLVSSDAPYNDFVRLFNNFLKAVHLRTEKDERRSSKEKNKEAKKARK